MLAFASLSLLLFATHGLSTPPAPGNSFLCSFVSVCLSPLHSCISLTLLSRGPPIQWCQCSFEFSLLCDCTIETSRIQLLFWVKLCMVACLCTYVIVEVGGVPLNPTRYWGDSDPRPQTLSQSASKICKKDTRVLEQSLCNPPEGPKFSLL